MKTCTKILSFFDGFRYGKTHAILKVTKPSDPSNIEYITACGNKFHHLLVVIDKRPVDCKKCLAGR